MRRKMKEKKNEITVPDKHQKRIAIDTVKNPNKSLLGGPTEKEAIEILKTKFGYSDRDIEKLQRESVENVIEIQEDVRVPGSDVILEKGDRIKIILESSNITLASWRELIRRGVVDGKDDREFRTFEAWLDTDFWNVWGEGADPIEIADAYEEVLEDSKRDAYSPY